MRVVPQLLEIFKEREWRVKSRYVRVPRGLLPCYTAKAVEAQRPWAQCPDHRKTASTPRWDRETFPKTIQNGLTIKPDLKVRGQAWGVKYLYLKQHLRENAQVCRKVLAGWDFSLKSTAKINSTFLTWKVIQIQTDVQDASAAPSSGPYKPFSSIPPGARDPVLWGVTGGKLTSCGMWAVISAPWRPGSRSEGCGAVWDPGLQRLRMDGTPDPEVTACRVPG